MDVYNADAGVAGVGRCLSCRGWATLKLQAWATPRWRHLATLKLQALGYTKAASVMALSSDTVPGFAMPQDSNFCVRLASWRGSASEFAHHQQCKVSAALQRVSSNAKCRCPIISSTKCRPPCRVSAGASTI
eukprot:563377-Pelagomonas_calceolata.AAC.4